VLTEEMPERNVVVCEEIDTLFLKNNALQGGMRWGRLRLCLLDMKEGRGVKGGKLCKFERCRRSGGKCEVLSGRWR
jgi:hypothetical protein